MAQEDRDQLRARAQQLLNAGSPDIVELLRMAKRLYISEESVMSRRLTRRAREAARAQADAMLEGAKVDGVAGKALAKLLNGLTEHAHARRILTRVREQDPKDIGAAQQLALSIYKDEELPSDSRFADALAILDEIGLHEPDCDDPETLGQGGAIYKRSWERGGQVEDLYTSLHFYRKGWQTNPRQDMGYCGVNAAFILDLLAYSARIAAAKEEAVAGHADTLGEQARSMRTEMLQTLPTFAAADADTRGQYWYLVTMAEIAFGLGRWEAAGDWLAQARQAEHNEWERQTTAKQLVAIARMRGILPPTEGKERADWDEPWRALYVLLGEDAVAAFDSYRGKVGLALSGGGFRASLFHLGVLARLAECDALRCVEVLSTVSGGSIVGAHYYLALRHRLRTKTDGELSRDAYLAIVREVMDQFCAGVLQNLRVRALSNLWANIKMLLTRAYGRSNRMGELYERYLYAAVPDGHVPGALRKMRELLIHPLRRRGTGGAPDERDEDFKPRFSNWRRKAKVPVLLLNATSLNSGHDWHFTASWMGEPPGLAGEVVDMNQRYRRLYYWQAPTEHLQNYPLGYAVAASAGVPALFDPLVLDGLYPDRTVRLVDGGVHDNQGVAGLLDEGCSLILCSDASGQMNDQNSPASGVLSVLLRSDTILQDRLREAQYQDLAWRTQSHALQGLFFIHLKQELQTDPIDWVDCQDPGHPTRRPNCTSYGVDRKIQRCLSEVRTDLDTFTEVEAYALMASGYLMTEHQLQELDKAHKSEGLYGSWAGFDVAAPRRNDWPFASLLPVMAADPEGSDHRARDLAFQLSVSRMLFGKVWKLIPPLSATAIALALVGIAAGGFWVYENWENKYTLQYEFSVNELVIGIAVLLAGVLLPFGKFVKPLETIRKWIIMVVMATIGCVISNIHLWLFDPLFKRRGSLAQLLQLHAPGRPLDCVMSGNPSTYSLTAAQLQQANEVLDEAKNAFQLTPRMQLLYKLLRLSVYAGACAFVGLAVGMVWDEIRGVFEFGPIDVAILLVLVIAMLSSSVLLLCNVPLIYRIFRQQVLLRRLGLRDVSVSMWKTQRRTRRWERIGIGLIVTVGVLLLVLAVGLLLGHSKDKLLAVTLCLALGGPIVAQWLVQRGKERIEVVADADRLQKLLLQLRQGTDVRESIAVPADVWEMVAQIESAQIARQRAEAVAARVEVGTDCYRVLVPRDVTMQKAALDLQDRLIVEELIEEVGDNPRAAQATTSETGGNWHRKLPGGKFEIAYDIDEPKRQVRLVELRYLRTEEAAAAQPMEVRHV